MAHEHNIKISEVLTGPTGKAGLVIEHGSEKLVLSSHGLNTFTVVGMKQTPIVGGKASHILEEVLKEIHDNGGKLPNGVKAKLGDVLPHFEGKGVYSGLLDKVKSDVALIDSLKGLKVEEAEALLVKNSHLKALLTTEETSRLNQLGVDLAGIEKKAAAVLSQTQNVETLTKELNTLLSAEKFDAKAVGSFMTKHAHQLEHITPSAEALGKAAISSNGKYSYEHAVQTVVAEVEQHATKVKGLLGEWLEHQRVAKLDPNPSKVSAAKEAAAKIETELKPILGGEYGEAIKGKLPKELVENASHHGGDLGKSLATGATEKGGKIGGFVSKIFVRGDAAEKGLTGIRKLSIGKTGAVAAGAVALAYVAGVGRNPKGKYTEQVAQQQLDGQQASVGVA